MTDTLAIWNKFADIDPKFTKPIKGKPYKGTSPNPHYVIRCLTEMFGPVGKGFGWEVVAEGFQPMGDELLHWCRIRFWHGDGPGFDAYGQTKAVMKTQSGFMSDEDAPKKSLTDAITKAASQIGIASNIFLGRWDDSKYVAEVNQTFRESEQAAKPVQKVSVEEAAILTDLAKRAGTDRVGVFAAMKLEGDSWADLPAEWFQGVRKRMQQKIDQMDMDHDAALRSADPAMQAPHEYQ